MLNLARGNRSLFRYLSILVAIFFTALFIFRSWSAQADIDTANTNANKSLNYLDFVQLILAEDSLELAPTIERLHASWSNKYIPMVLETIDYTRSRAIRRHLEDILEEKTDYTHADSMNDWYQWLWNQSEYISDDYADFKAALFVNIDPRFEAYFKGRQASAQIRLDEIRWGGVEQDGIPPLRNPKMLSADQQNYLEDSNVVFGVKINGEARAYPKRILAWHEMFTDTFGQGDAAEPIAGVYCTLCGTVIIYKTQHDGVSHELGTSGFLYRSNKLMYDKATQSLWNTVRGEPVVGPLVGKGIALEHLSVVTTTWAEWKRRHPETTVLSLDTGHQRDYGEGVAYNDYFSNDNLMFNTPFNDRRLDNKREVLALRFPGAPNTQLAIDTEFLAKNPIFYESVGAQKMVIITDQSGANRVYQPGGIRFEHFDGKETLKDQQGATWRVTEEALVSEHGKQLNRLPYHRAFWFGWHAAYPKTRLIK